MTKCSPGFWLSALFASLCGCSVGPDYQRPPLHPPETFRNERLTAGNTNSFGDLTWQEVFRDEHLRTLIRIALTNNYDLRMAAARVEQARAQVGQARSQFFPQLNYGAIAGRGKNVSIGNTPSPNGTSGAVFAPFGTASWEIDLFGRIRRLNEAARAQYFATREARHDVIISLIAQVAQGYFQLLALDTQLQIAHKSTNSFGQSLRIFNQRLQGGIASKLETSSAAAQMNSAAATIPELERQVGVQENQLSVLIGKNPEPIKRATDPSENPDWLTVPAGLPSALLERRPDIRQAEQQLREANAQLGVAVADFFPRLNLTGLLGGVSPELSAFTGGGDLAWSVAAGLTGPIFHGGQLRARYDQVLAARQEAALRYHSTLLNALQEVSSALLAREKLTEVRELQVRAVEANEEAVKISMERYRLGNASYYEVLQSQEQLFPAENILAQARLGQALSIVQLYRALGGGWQKAADAKW